jgi:hypothetical protein
MKLKSKKRKIKKIKITMAGFKLKEIKKIMMMMDGFKSKVINNDLFNMSFNMNYSTSILDFLEPNLIKFILKL